MNIETKIYKKKILNMFNKEYYFTTSKVKDFYLQGNRIYFQLSPFGRWSNSIYKETIFYTFFKKHNIRIDDFRKKDI